MSSVPLLHVFHPDIVRTQTVRPSRPGLFRLLVEAVAASNRRRAEREISRFIQHNGGQITDNVERMIQHRLR